VAGPTPPGQPDSRSDALSTSAADPQMATPALKSIKSAVQSRKRNHEAQSKIKKNINQSEDTFYERRAGVICQLQRSATLKKATTKKQYGREA